MNESETPEDAARSTLDGSLVDILVCPVCHEGVRPEQSELVCTGCGRRYPVREGVPVMLPEEATPPTRE